MGPHVKILCLIIIALVPWDSLEKTVTRVRRLKTQTIMSYLPLSLNVKILLSAIRYFMFKDLDKIRSVRLHNVQLLNKVYFPVANKLLLPACPSIPFDRLLVLKRCIL